MRDLKAKNYAPLVYQFHADHIAPGTLPDLPKGSKGRFSHFNRLTTILFRGR